MKVLLDSKDLIDIVEHDPPVQLEEFRNYLHDHNSSLVLTFNNVRELVAPLAQGINPLHVRALLQRLETLPLSYLGEVNIPTDEVKQAVRAFNSATEYKAINPWVSRWDETIPGPKPSVGKMLILRLYEIVLDIARVDASVFSGYSFYKDALRQQFENDRRISPSARVPEQNFPKVVGRLIKHYGIEKPMALGTILLSGYIKILAAVPVFVWAMKSFMSC
jgi:hypothetical protein